MSDDIICDGCKRADEPLLEALNYTCGHLVHLCSECHREVARRVTANDWPFSEAELALLPKVNVVADRIRVAAIAHARSSHDCPTRIATVASIGEAAKALMPGLLARAEDVIIRRVSVETFGAHVGNELANAAAASREMVVTPDAVGPAMARIMSTTDVQAWAERAIGAPARSLGPEIKERPDLGVLGELLPKGTKFHVGVDLAAVGAERTSGVAMEPCPGCGADPCDGNQVCQCDDEGKVDGALEADGDVTVHPPLPTPPTRQLGTLRVVGKDPHDPGIVRVAVHDPEATTRDELRERSAAFLRDLLAKVEAGEFLQFAGVAWGGASGASVFYSDLERPAEAIGYIEIARASLVDDLLVEP